MGQQPNQKIRKKRTGKTPAPVNQPNFSLVGTAYRTPTEMLDMLLFSEVERRGKTRWEVRARFDEWVHGGAPHTVHIQGATLVCDCRQGVAARECHHVVAVRQLGRVAPWRVDEQQLRIFPEPEGLVRVDDRRQRGRRRG